MSIVSVSRSPTVDRTTASKRVAVSRSGAGRARVGANREPAEQRVLSYHIGTPGTTFMPLQDVRIAFRRLTMARASTLAAIGMLAIGIGTAVVMADMLDRLLLRPPPHV